MVGRNDSCPCGSGKKYKRCCLNKKSNNFLEQQTADELKHILLNAYEQSASAEDLIEFRQYMKEWKGKLEGSWPKERVEEAISAYFLFVKRNDLWQRQLEQALNGALRTTTRAVLETWNEPIVLLGKVKGERDGLLEVKQLLSDQVYCLKKVEGMPNDPQALVFGIVFPDNRQHPNGLYIVSSLMFTKDENDLLEEAIIALSEANHSLEGIEFYKEYMVNIYEVILGKTLSTTEGSEHVESEEIVEPKVEEELVVEQESEVEEELIEEAQLELTPIQQEVVALLDQTLQERAIEAKEQARVRHVCETYMSEEQPNFRKANVVAAGVYRAAIDCELLTEEKLTNSAVAALFDISPASMTKHAESVRQLIPQLYAEEEMTF